MNIEELKNAIDVCYEQIEFSPKNPKEITVCIPVYRLGCYGHRPCVDIISANLGFDWESKSFILIPEVNLREIDRNEIKELSDKYEELNWKHYKITQLKRENKELKDKLQQLLKLNEESLEDFKFIWNKK